MTSEEFANLKVGDIVGLSWDKLGIKNEIVFHKGADLFQCVNEYGDISHIYTDDVLFPEYMIFSNNQSPLEVDHVLRGIRDKIEDLEDISNILKGL